MAEFGDFGCLVPSSCAAIARNLISNPSASVLLLGTVEQLQVGYVYADFVLNDTTARLPVRLFHNGLFTPESLVGLLTGYIRVIGRISSIQPLHVISEYVRPVAHADEVSFHFIEVAYTYLRSNGGGSSVHVQGGDHAGR
jgi:hypothetical protein